MSGWLCAFLPHRWQHIRFGIWQCTRCKSLSLGRAIPVADAEMPSAPGGAP